MKDQVPLLYHKKFVIYHHKSKLRYTKTLSTTKDNIYQSCNLRFFCYSHIWHFRNSNISRLVFFFHEQTTKRYLTIFYIHDSLFSSFFSSLPVFVFLSFSCLCAFLLSFIFFPCLYSSLFSSFFMLFPLSPLSLLP